MCRLWCARGEIRCEKGADRKLVAFDRVTVPGVYVDLVDAADPRDLTPRERELKTPGIDSFTIPLRTML